MTISRPRALVADDEQLLRARIMRGLRELWPELEIVAEAKNGREAVEAFEALRPEICFLDVQMPGMSGVEAARLIGERAHIVFVTAYQQYAIEAFEHGALDYLVKPVAAARLASTVARLKNRLDAPKPARDFDAMLEALATRLQGSPSPTTLRWMRVSMGNVVRVVSVDAVDFFRAEDKYTLVAWRNEENRLSEGVVRTAIRDLAPQLDRERFVQIHRAIIVNLGSIRQVVRLENETAQVFIRGRDDVLPVSRAFAHLFRQM